MNELYKRVKLDREDFVVTEHAYAKDESDARSNKQETKEGSA